MLLAVGAVPGSIFPQRSIDPGRVADYIAANPTVAPWLDRLSFFDVFGASAAVAVVSVSVICSTPSLCSQSMAEAYMSQSMHMTLACLT